MKNPPPSWIASLIKRKASTPPALAYDAHYAVRRRARKTDGLVTAGTFGTHLTRAECAPLVFTSGLRHSASRAPSGRRIRIGT